MQINRNRETERQGERGLYVSLSKSVAVETALCQGSISPDAAHEGGR
jgi:hypothetical protein